MSKIIAFYNGEHILRGKTLSGVQMFNYEHMDLCHDFIQWMFPTLEQSAHHPTAPILTLEDIEEFKADPVLKKKLRCSFSKFLGFLGLYLDYRVDGDAWVGLAGNYDDRRLHWQTPHNHNYLRITRVLTCLRLCGLENEAKAFFKVLDYLFWKHYGSIPEESYHYWSNALKTS